jgi:hypothetical protein
MTREDFDQYTFKKGTKILYKGKVYEVDTVRLNDGEVMFRDKYQTDAWANWKQFEFVSDNYVETPQTEDAEPAPAPVIECG